MFIEPTFAAEDQVPTEEEFEAFVAGLPAPCGAAYPPEAYWIELARRLLRRIFPR